MKKTIFTVVLFAFAAQVMLLAQQVTDISLSTLLNEIDSNSARANQTYNGRTLRLTGVINSIDDVSLILAVSNNEWWKSIHVYITASDRTKLINLNAGQRITVRGLYRNGGIFGAVIETATAQPTPAPAPTPTPNNSTQARTANERGVAFFNQRNWDSAIAQFTEAIRLTPNDAVFYGNRGNAYFNKADFDRAITDYTEAIRLASNNADYYSWRANAYANKGNLTQARTDINRALQISPNNQNARNISADIQRLEQQQQQARATPTPTPTPAPAPAPASPYHGTWFDSGRVGVTTATRTIIITNNEFRITSSFGSYLYLTIDSWTAVSNPNRSAVNRNFPSGYLLTHRVSAQRDWLSFSSSYVYLHNDGRSLIWMPSDPDPGDDPWAFIKQ